MSEIRVKLGSRSYTILVEAGSLGRAGETLERCWSGRRAILFTHPALAEPYAQPVAKGLRDQGREVFIIEAPAGERFKTVRTVIRLYRRLAEIGADRSSLIVSVGGGVLGDVAGFTAATYMRGIAFAQVPTTLLAQVDASIGGKVGVDLPFAKNMVGAFHQPVAVIIDPMTLKTLSLRELRCGIAEVIKYGIIASESLYGEIKSTIRSILRREPSALERVIVGSCEIKANIVAEDETEQGRRAILNFGHTVGHALEVVTGYRRHKHGEAVAIGMITALIIGEMMGTTPTGIREDVAGLLQNAGLPIGFPPDIPVEAILQAARMDKKRVADRTRFILVPKIGETVVTSEVTEKTLHEAIQRHQSLK
ncbi:MAG: 3-dehydroquinate synthase [Armatimonadetes bacterium]|nr:3-dehydroquinate synthase [Armatimonadota bacterium]